MKRILTSFLILGLGMGVATAQSFTTGHAGYVLFTDGHSARPVGESPEQCEANMERITEEYLAAHAGVEVRESLPCGPRSSTIPELDLDAWLKLDIPPLCLSCPLLGPETFEIYYPDFTGQIKELYYGFKINQYNKELRTLQQKYDLGGFEAEVFKLNNELNQYQK